MDFATLRAANLSRCARWHPRGLSEWSLSDWFTATMGELGEAANIAKKLNRERDGIAGDGKSASLGLMGAGLFMAALILTERA